MNNDFFKNFGAAFISSPSNLFYFSGFQNEDARIVLTPEKKYYFTDMRIIEEARELLTDFEIKNVERGEYTETACAFLRETGITRVGYEDAVITHAEFLKLSENNFELIPAQELIDGLRAVKSEREVNLIKEAQKVTDKVFEEILSFIEPGVTERETAAKINSLIYGYGCSLAFDTIAAFGKNTSKPHSHPGDYALKNGDCVLLDYGAKYNGYCSDMTRTFCVGAPHKRFSEIYNTVLDAQNIALDNIRAGLTGVQCDAFARDYFKNKGLDGYFTHSLGHSLGVDIHESPNLNTRNQGKIPAGAVITVEPGLYFEGEFGVRIEDMVLFKNNFAENLTKSPKKLIIL